MACMARRQVIGCLPDFSLVEFECQFSGDAFFVSNVNDRIRSQALSNRKGQGGLWLFSILRPPGSKEAFGHQPGWYQRNNCDDYHDRGPVTEVGPNSGGLVNFLE